MTRCLFVSDLHGREGRYRRLYGLLEAQAPRILLLGGDLLPAGPPGPAAFARQALAGGFRRLRRRLGSRYPEVLLIPGNDDPRSVEPLLLEGEEEGLWRYMHGRKERIDGRAFYGYACIPPSPFLLKDWERYDVSRHVDVGCVGPTEGRRTVPVRREEIERSTIETELQALAGREDLTEAVLLFHAPPYDSALDRAALDGRTVEFAPLDVHVGSIAVRRFIERRQPLLTLHGHIHESARLTGSWRERIGRTWCLSAAHDGPELAVVEFTLEDPQGASRRLLAPGG